MITAHSAGSSAGVESVHAAVVYDKATGKVVHTHHMLIFKGAIVRPGPDEIARMALEHAEAAGVKRDHVDALYAGASELDPTQCYRVDPATRKLIAEPGPEPRRR
jgi:hypothetical protein